MTLARYRRIMARFDDDPEMIKGITGLIEEAEAEKLALHPVDGAHPPSGTGSLASGSKRLSTSDRRAARTSNQ